MAVRDFGDDEGRQWRAWAITPEAIEPVTRGEDYLADCFVTGWVVFETIDGKEKRRLCPWPMRWAEMSDEELRGLLQKATPIRHVDMRARHTGSAAEGEGEGDGWTDGEETGESPVVRTFAYPGGRFWTVWVLMRPSDGGPPVLRFQAGARYMDLRRWPTNWSEQTDASLITLLRNGAPRESEPAPGETRHRRWNDRPTRELPM